MPRQRSTDVAGSDDCGCHGDSLLLLDTATNEPYPPGIPAERATPRRLSRGQAGADNTKDMSRKRPRQSDSAFSTLTPDQQRTWLAYMRVQLRLNYEMNRQLQADSNLSLPDYDVLNALRFEQGRVRHKLLLTTNQEPTQPAK